MIKWRNDMVRHINRFTQMLFNYNCVLNYLAQAHKYAKVVTIKNVD